MISTSTLKYFSKLQGGQAIPCPSADEMEINFDLWM